MIKFLFALVFAQAASSTFILLPLYIYPSESAWDLVYENIEKYPQIQWQIIVNPNSGPGPINSFPSSDYITAISKLNSYENVLTLGYVATGWTQVPLATVRAEISTYANWARFSSANISMAGIFFDEAPYSWSLVSLQYMRSASSFAYSTMPSTVTPVIFNPGTHTLPALYFSSADTIVLYENYYSNYANQTTINRFPRGYNAQSAIIVHSSTASRNSLSCLVRNIMANGIGGVYFTSDCCYQDISHLSKLAAAININDNEDD